MHIDYNDILNDFSIVGYIEMIQKIFKNKYSVIFLALLVSLLWGSLFSAIKIGYREFAIGSGDVWAILLFAGLRFFLSGLLLVGEETIREKRLRIPVANEFKMIFIVSMFTVILHYAFTYTALSLCDSSKSAVLKQVGFLFVPCIMFMIRNDEKFSIAKVVAGIMGFISVIVINLDGLNFIFGVGELLVILASLSNVIGQIVSKNVYDKYEPARTVAYSQLTGGIVLIVFGLILGGRITVWTLSSVAVLLYICAASIMANLLWNTLIKYNDMSKLSILKSADPIFASAFSAVLLGENIFRIEFMIAIALVFAAILISNIKFKKN